MGLTRRKFVTAAGVGAGAAAFGIGSAPAIPAPPPSRWDVEADVVVVGYGGAGAVTAITAHDAGAKVLILEKQPASGHTSNTRMSLAVFLSPTDVDAAVAYMEVASRINPRIPDSQALDDAIIQIWARYMSQNRDYLRGLGVANFAVFYDQGIEPSWPGNEAMKAYVPVDANGNQPGGVGLYELLAGHLRSRNIDVRWDTPATQLVQSPGGEILGVLAGRPEREIAVRASKAVVLTCGGFEYDTAALKAYMPVYPCVSYGNPDNTGDGLRMAVAAGADLWHMTSLTGSFKVKFPDFPTAFGVAFANSGLIVDQSGRRFKAETQLGGYDGIYNAVLYDPVTHTWPRVPAYLIFDERRRLASPMVPTTFGAAGPIGMYRWSADNSAEVERGWIIRSRTIAGLAGQLDLDAVTVEAEVARYNGFARAGVDADFARTPETLVPVAQAPFYAMRLWPGLNNTLGGPRRNADAQVVAADGRVIPRLFSAGELGSVYVLYPQGGANLGECFAFGRIAGANAARLQGWT